MALKCDAVFEGGGVKGIGFAGAVSALEQKGYQFENLVGTSAGAIAACLVAVGYSGKEIEQELKSVNFKSFRENSRFGRLGVLGKMTNLSFRYGIYKADAFETWLSGLIEKKGKCCFGDIRTESTKEPYKYKFQAIASDLTNRRMLVLPRDMESFGISPDEFELAKAVRMSMSIPLYYEPFRLKDMGGEEHVIVDGGLLSNYPVWLLDDGTSNPPWPTFGLKFTCDDPKQCHVSEGKILNVMEYAKSLIATMMEAGDNYHISLSNGDFQRSIMIPTSIKVGQKGKVIRTTDFDITAEEGAALANNGRLATERFLKTWDFATWKRTYRNSGGFQF